MVFSSAIFLWAFLPITLCFYFAVRKELKNLILLLANLIFYGWGEPKFLVFIVISILVNYTLGLWVDKETKISKKKLVLVISVVFNLSFLLFFKYFNFIIDNINILNSIFGINHIRVSKIFLPLGISFYTFQAMSYVIDVYRKEIRAQKNLIDLALYKTLFPQLIAGPIVRYKDIKDQILYREVNMTSFSFGIRRFIIGLSKKVLIANTVATLGDRIFSINGNELTIGLAWMAILCYTLQIYYDFSGYSDMAIGLGHILGFRFPENFNYPYISKSIKEFWRRWHISLSSWFRDYLYIPLGGNRCKTSRVYFNLILVFLLCGLWHGSSWNFVIWGLFHGMFLALERTKFGIIIDKLWRPLKHIYAMTLIMIGWVFFRTNSISTALHFIKTMFGFGKITSREYQISDFISISALLGIVAGIIFLTPIAKNIYDIYLSKIKNLKYSKVINLFSSCIYIGVIFTMLFVCMMSLASGTYNPFIYFKF